MQKIIYWIASFLLGCAVGACLLEKEEHTDGESVRDTVIDTVRYDMPVARDSAVVRYIKVVVPVKKDTETSKNYAQNSAEIMHGEPCPALAVDSDSVSVVLPVTQKHYKDSTYDYQPYVDLFGFFAFRHFLFGLFVFSLFLFRFLLFGFFLFGLFLFGLLHFDFFLYRFRLFFFLFFIRHFSILLKAILITEPVREASISVL